MGHKWSLMENRPMSGKKYIMPLRGTKQQSAEDFLVDYGDCLNGDRLVICLY